MSPQLENPHLRDRILTDKERKNLAILDIVRRSGPVSRTDISNITGFNVVTVSNYINHYIDTKLVFEKETDESTGGRKPVLVSLNPAIGKCIGVGLNADTMTAVLVGLECRILREIKIKREPKNNENTVRELLTLTEKLMAETNTTAEDLFGIGVGVPGVVDSKNKTVRWAGAIGEENYDSAIDIEKQFEEKFNVPVLVENDANTAVLAEKWLGLGKDVRHVLYLSSGVGCGILIDGEIYCGGSGVAGEIGIFDGEGDVDSALKSASGLGRWETDLGMIRSITSKINAGETSLLSGVLKEKGKIKLSNIVEAVKAGDKLSKETLSEVSNILGKKAAFLINLLNPEVVVVGGGIEDFGADIIGPLKEAVNKHTFPESSHLVRIIPSAFGEKAVALGAASIVCREVFAQA